jgi:hypothetical protein
VPRQPNQQAAAALSAATPALLWLLVATVTMSAGALLADEAAARTWLGFVLIAVALVNVPAAARVAGHTGGWWFVAALAALADQVAASLGLVLARYAFASLAVIAALRAFSLFYEKRGLHKRIARPTGPFFRSTG